jgi:hypothetical protein
MGALGDRMKRKEALLAEFKANGLPSPETPAFAGRTLEQGEPVEGKAPV